MILTCPKCETRFALPAQALAPTGKNVKCSNCAHVWFQEPDTDELIEDLESVPSEELEEAFEDIVENLAEEIAEDDTPEEETIEREEINPEDIGFGDVSEDDDNKTSEEEETDSHIEEENKEEPDIPDAVKPLPQKKTAKTNGAGTQKSLIVAAVSGIVFATILILPALAYKDGIIQSWPKSMAFYNMLGLDATIPGDGIVFDAMRSKISENALEINGQVINLTSSTKTMPLIEISLKDENGRAIKHFYVNEEAKKLVAETTMPISAKFDLSESDAKNARDTSIQFVIQKKN